MITPSAALAELMRSPELPSYVKGLQQELEWEERRRLRFYEDLDPSTKAEFINGQVIIHSPARLEHLRVSSRLTALLHSYAECHDLGVVFVEKCLIHCERNDYEPDICFFGAEKTAGLEPGQKIFPPPDLAVEILSPSTEQNDRDLKLRDYAHHRIAEYWIVDADTRTIEQYRLPDGSDTYALHATTDARGQLKSHAVKGFDVPAAAIFDARENQRALAAILRGVA